MIKYSDILQDITLFSYLPEKELHIAINKMKVKSFAKNEIVLLQNDANEYMYIVLEGEVKVVTFDNQGKETLLAIHQKGEYFGEISLIDEKATSATVVSKGKSIIAIISKNNFYDLIYNNKNVLNNLLKTFCFRIRGALETIRMLNNNQATTRIGLLFRKLLEQYGQKSNDGMVLHIKLTHQDIANMTGLTRQTVTRVIDDFKKDALITVLDNKSIFFGKDFLNLSYE